MDAETGPANSAQYFARSNPESLFLNRPNQFIANAGFNNSNYPFTPPSPINPFLGNGFQLPFPNTSYPECSRNFQLPVEKPNPVSSSRFKWSQNTKPQFAFSLNSTEPHYLNADSYSKLATGTFGYKRKTKSPPPVPLKQHITEERMAEHMSQLHISSETPTTQPETEPVRECRLYMCEEMQRLQAESIIPIQILEKVQRPCTALIPWRPPVVPAVNKENDNNNKEEELDNNLPLLSDNGVMDISS